MLQVKIQKLHPDAILPKFHAHGAAGFDFYSLLSGRIDPPSVASIATGIALEIPEGYAMLLVANNKNGPKYGVSIANGFSIIGSDHRGEIILSMSASCPFKFFNGDRLAQGIILPIPSIELVHVGALPPAIAHNEQPFASAFNVAQPYYFG